MKVDEKREQLHKLAQEMRRMADWLDWRSGHDSMGQLRVIPPDAFTRAKRRLGLIRYIFKIEKE